MQTNDSKHQENNDFEGTHATMWYKHTHTRSVHSTHIENTHRK